MTIQVTCPTCGKTLHAKEEWVGKSVRCPGCKSVVPVKEESPWAEPEPPQQTARYEEDEPPPRRARYEEDDEPPRRYRDEDDRPARRRGRDEDDDGYRSRYGRELEPTSKAVPILMLVGGGIAILGNVVGFLVIPCWPPFWYGGVQGVIAFVMGIVGLSKGGQVPKWPAILQIISIIGCDVVNLTFGIIELVLITSPKNR